MTVYLAPPNDGVDQISYLVHGRDEYEDYQEVKAYHRENNEWWAGDRKGPRPIHWRQRVRDLFAGICIYEDPTHTPTQEDGWRRRWLYEPAELQELLITTPRVIKAIHHAVEQDYDISSARQVHKQILSVFRNEFRSVWEQWYDHAGSLVSTGKKEDDWRKAGKYLEQTAELIAGCLYLNYDHNPLEWSSRVIQYGEPSDRWKQHIERVNRLHDKPTIERVTGRSASFSFEETTGDIAEVGLVESESMQPKAPSFVEEE